MDKCLTSLIVEDKYMEMLEILIVNDGSKDNSSAVAHRYEDKYSQTFRVIDKENGNYGSCINRALKEATGKYIKILDADDMFDNQAWTEFLCELKEMDVDLVLTNYDLVDERGELVEHRQFNMPTGSPQKSTDVIKALLEVEMHAITYKRKVLIGIDYQQTEGIFYTDTEWVVLPMTSIKTVVYSPITLYKYLVGREGQTMIPKTYWARRHERLLIHNRFLDFFTNGNMQRCPMKAYIQPKLYGIFLRNYTASLINRQFPSEELEDFDNRLHEKAPEIYKMLGAIKFSNIPVVALWRQNGHHLPLATGLVIRMIRFKQTYFPWLKIRRIQNLNI